MKFQIGIFHSSLIKIQFAGGNFATLKCNYNLSSEERQYVDEFLFINDFQFDSGFLILRILVALVIGR